MDRVVAELAALNKKADEIISIMQKPDNRFEKTMEIIGNIVGIISVLAIVDIIRTWVLGG